MHNDKDLMMTKTMVTSLHKLYCKCRLEHWKHWVYWSLLEVVYFQFIMWFCTLKSNHYQ